jgi:phenylacetate-coenzyme A ligase PaaK-like adenylate-forming protein
MNLAAFSTVLFGLGRHVPRLPLAVFRTMPVGVLQAMRRPGLRRTLRMARRSPFYREALARVDPRAVRTPADLGDFFLTPDVVKSRPEALLCARPEVAIESSGTSGRVTRIYLSRRELEYNARQGGLLLSLYGLGRDDRLLCTLDLAWGIGALLVERGVRYTPLFAMVPGRVSPEEAYERLAAYRFNVILSDPFWLARLTDLARAHGRPAPMRLLVGGGESITARTRAELERFWEAPLCMTYASTEAATVFGFECLQQAGYHVNEFDFYIEIDRPDADGYGELVLTTVNRDVMPLIRYRTGDIARWLRGRCRCGLGFRRISPLRGRVDEQVSCAWGNVVPEFFEDLLRDVGGLGGDWQVALYERALTPVFQFRLEIDGPAHREKAVDTVLQALQRRRPEAWGAYCQRLVDIEFSFFPRGALRRQRKLLRVVDERADGVPAWVGEAIDTVRRP